MYGAMIRAKDYLKAGAKVLVQRFAPTLMRGMIQGNIETGIDRLTNRELVALLDDLDFAVTKANEALGRTEAGA